MEERNAEIGDAESDPASDRRHVECPQTRPAEEVKFPGMLVFQEVFGVNAHIRDVAQRIARKGYLALAPALFHHTAPGFEGSYTDMQSVMPHMQAVNQESAVQDIRAAYEWLKSNVQNRPRSYSRHRLLHAKTNVLPGKFRGPTARRDFVLWRGHRAGISSARSESFGAHALLLVRARPTHSSGSDPHASARTAGPEQTAHQRGNFRRRSRIFL